MSRKRLVSYVLILVAALGLLTPVTYYLWTRARGVYVGVTNNTSDVIERVEIAYTGGVIHIASLPPKASQGSRINPTGESWVKLTWVDSSGKEHSHETTVYIEPHYTGSLEIVIEPNDTVSSIDKTRPYFF